MKRRKTFLVFFIKCIAIPAAALLLLFELNKSYRKYDDEKYRDMWGLWTLGNQVDNVKIANVGSSHGAYDFVYDVFAEKGIPCFNFGHTSQTYNYDLALLSEYGHHLDQGCVLFIPVSYFSFNNETTNKTEAQALSVKYYHFLSPENVPDYDLFTDVVTHRLPILSAGEDLLKLLPGQSFSLTVLAAEKPDVPAPDEAAIAVFSEQAASRFDRHFNGKEEYFLPEREEELYAIIDYCKKHGITPVLITTPFSCYYNAPVPENFLDRFYSTVNRIASDMDVSYYDYSHDARFTDDLALFSDPDHLTEEGAAYFTAILAEEVPELRAVLSK